MNQHRALLFRQLLVIKPIYVNHNTRYEDGLTFDTLTNQRVEAETYKVNNQYIASEIEAEDND